MRWIFFFPHPDDLEYFVGNLLVNLGNRKEIHNIQIICLTRGEMSAFTEETKSSKIAAFVRTQELLDSMQILQMPTPKFLGEFDGFIRITEKLIKKIQSTIEDFQPNIIIAPEPIYTFYHHPDHVRTGKVVYLALKRSMNNINTKKRPHLLFFSSLVNTIYFPITQNSEKVVQEALQKHRSQQALLKAAKIPAIISAFMNGLKISGAWKAEGLRYQQVTKSNRGKYPKGFRIVKRILYYLTKPKREELDYSKRMQFMDGTIF